MDPLNNYTIPFVGLSFGKHEYLFKLDQSFFEPFQYTEIQNMNCQAEVILDKKNTFFEIHVLVDGVVTLLCDVSNEPFENPIQNNLDIIVKFGDAFIDDDDRILILPQEAFEINVAQYIYEAILLAVPIKKEHPGLRDGSLQSEVLEKLKELEIQEKPILDPRWDKLNQLLTSKKQ